jgi:predicted DCC family thiol-disulfide oxidoreductase YuxK
MESQPKITVYYDGVCNLCSSLMATVAQSSHGSAFAPVDISGGQLPQGVSKEAAMHDVHVVDAQGRVYKGADAVLKILEQYPRLRFLSSLGRAPASSHIAAGVYRLVEKTRYWIFGRKRV